MDKYQDISMSEAAGMGIPIARIIGGLTAEQSASLCRGEAVTTDQGTLFPLLTKLPGAEEPMVTAILSHLTQDMLDARKSTHERFKANLSDLLKACHAAAPEALPAIKELLESYREYDNSTNAVIDTVLNDYQNMLVSFGALPALTIRAERGSAANKMHQASSAGKAKVAAQQLWPQASRRGWTAVRLHTELVSRGHEVSPGRVAKWLTSLRKTGRC